MKKNMLWVLLLLVYACKKDNDVQPAPANTGKIQLIFEAYVDSIPMQLYTGKYLSPANDTFTVGQFKFFVHFQSMSGTGANFTEKGSYNLISYTSELVKNSFVLDSVAVGDYSNLRFDIGVDTIKNHSLENSGDLEPGNGMDWDWNTGYKFLLLEGEYATLQHKGSLVFHVGEDKNYKALHFDLPSTLKVEGGKTSQVKVKVNINGMFRSPYLIDFDLIHQAMQNADADKIAYNYAKGMFTISQIVNP